MNTRTPSAIAAIILATAAAGSFVHAQNPSSSAREAINSVSNQFGPGAVQWLAELKGTNGMPQPPTWEILAYSDRAPRLLHRFWGGQGRAGDAGVDEQRYPINIPVGYFSLNQISVDSVAAFTIAEGEARKAQMAFDSCSYLLRVREYSTEPIWRLELLDPTRRLVGKIYLSARNGEVLRTVWVYYTQGARPQIIDSFAPGRSAMTTDSTGTLPPLQETGVADSTGILSPPAVQPGTATIPGPPVSPTFPSNNNPTGGLQPYNPGVTSNGPGVMAPPSTDPQYNDGGIPEPPAITNQDMKDLRDAPIPQIDPAKPPIDVPDTGGSSERIPPPPIPQP